MSSPPSQYGHSMPLGKKSANEINSYFLIQLKDSGAKSVFSMCKELVSVPGVSAASGISGIFDILAKVSLDQNGTEKLLADLRGKEQVEFVSPFEVDSVHMPGQGLPNFRARKKGLLEKSAVVEDSHTGSPIILSPAGHFLNTPLSFPENV